MSYRQCVGFMTSSDCLAMLQTQHLKDQCTCLHRVLALGPCMCGCIHSGPSSRALFLLQVAQKLGLQCLVEVHTIAELERILKLDVLHEKCMLGINNRDLQTFKVDLGNNKVIMESEAGRRAVSKGLIFAGESGINTPEDVRFVKVSQCNWYLYCHCCQEDKVGQKAGDSHMLCFACPGLIL